MQQRRDAYRVSFPVEARYAAAGRSPIWQDGMLSDVSAGGARLHGRIAVAGAVIVAVQFPDDFLAEMSSRRDRHEPSAFGARLRSVEVRPAPFAALTLEGTVVAASFDTAAKRFVHNVRFERVAPVDQTEIERYVNLRQRYELQSRRR